ncbi:MAG: hypothetical protein P1U62_00525 [Alteraurantiacibacter sp. bin_em_oilr2.035]|uniref:hypothetical protein n=1 Tax=Aurantiacibacter atlanticus TaxID=1648404 RepID=UPI000A58B17A|nr:hypothetical protein [Aurantiacibacter atlanticus]MDF1833347.1 hypothetical protein [Alteraurantiacibacter sp. bin_em_oilr2.035]
MSGLAKAPATPADGVGVGVGDDVGDGVGVGVGEVAEGAGAGLLEDPPQPVSNANAVTMGTERHNRNFIGSIYLQKREHALPQRHGHRTLEVQLLALLPRACFQVYS